MILGLGDCNMGGAEGFDGKTYIELVGQALGMEWVNRGITMSTTREGVILRKEYEEPDILVIGYGLVDSWKTFKYAPYVLYYPDNPLRKLGRKLVKKYKKIARSLGLNEILGQKYVVPPKEYETNIEYMLQQAKRVFLVETPPHHRQHFRNPDIKRYNDILRSIAQRHEHVSLVAIYDELACAKRFYLDDIHLNQAGYDLIARKILEQL